MTKIMEIIDKLQELSMQGRITWKPTVNEETFMAVLENSSVVTTRSKLEFLEPTYSLRIINESGLEVAEYHSSNSKAEEYTAIQDIYETARQSAVDTGLDSVLVELNRL